jgi:hypothetical protein
MLTAKVYSFAKITSCYVHMFAHKNSYNLRRGRGGDFGSLDAYDQ